MSFGFSEKTRMTGAGLYSRILTLTALLPALYIFIVSGYPSVITRGGILPFLCDVGAAALPRAELLFLSWLYRLTSSEIVFDFVMLALAVIFGVVSRRLLLGKRPREVRIVFAALVAADLVLRLVPAHFNIAFGWPAAVIGFAVRLGCLVLILLDLRAGKRASDSRNK
jgi:hypothetical protein